MGKLVTKQIVGKYPISFEAPFWWIDYSSTIPPKPIPVPGNYFLLENSMELSVSEQEYASYKVGDFYSYETPETNFTCLWLGVVIAGCWLAFILGVILLLR